MEKNKKETLKKCINNAKCLYEEEKKQKEHEKDLERLKRLRPTDDDFMRRLFRENIPLTQRVLRVLTQKSDLTVVTVETQADLKRLAGARSVCLDAYITDSGGKRYNLEVQRADKGAGAHRARYHSSVLDVENLDANHDFEELPDTYTIFITENDVFRKGKPFYPVERMNLETGELFHSGEHILYINGAYRGDDEIGKLMHDFSCSEPDLMYNHDLAEIVRYYKETQEGVEIMCKAMEDMKNESKISTYIEACMEFGVKDKEEIIHRLLAKFTFLTEIQARKYLTSNYE